MIEREILYDHDGTTLKGYLVSSSATPKPGVIISHAWGGRDQFAIDQAKKIAELGYTGFALDIYGDAKLGLSNEQCSALITPFMENRALLLGRLNAALGCIRAQSEADPKQIAAIGYCFGGLCALDLARSGADICGAVSFHGLLSAPSKTNKIKAKVLVLHGYLDPMATSEHVVAFANEMTEAASDWQMHMYGQTYHAFTNPAANDLDFGTVYDAAADKRSWQAMSNFLEEAFDSSTT